MSSARPDWDRLFETASAQAGLFTTKQAAEAGYSPQLLVHHLRTKRAQRLFRGVYRLVHFPPADQEELAAAWLWSDRTAVISHQTSLALHDLSDALPTKIHMTLPNSWRRRRLRMPAKIAAHYADVSPDETTWFGVVPITDVGRTLQDCADISLSPELLRKAAQQAIHRGLVAANELRGVEIALKPFGGIASG